MPALPTSLALASIADGSSIISADHRNNYAAIQTAENGLLTILGAGTVGQVLQSSGAGAVTWGAPSAGTFLRKATAKSVNTTIVATDLLNGEFTITGGLMGTTGFLRLTAWGDLLQNSGGNTAGFQFQLAFGGVVLLDTSSLAANAVTNSATRFGWKIHATIANLTAATQWATLEGALSCLGSVAQSTAFATGEGRYEASVAAVSTSRFIGTNSGAVDTTTNKLLELKVGNPSNNALCETKLTGALVEII